MTEEQMHQEATNIIQESVCDLEFMDVVERFEDEDATGEEIDRIYDLITGAKVTVTFND